jgi:hypothetical protein
MTHTEAQRDEPKRLSELCKESPVFKTLLIGCFSDRIRYNTKTGEINRKDAVSELRRKQQKEQEK